MKLPSQNQSILSFSVEAVQNVLPSAFAPPTQDDIFDSSVCDRFNNLLIINSEGVVSQRFDAYTGVACKCFDPPLGGQPKFKDPIVCDVDRCTN